MYAWIPRALGTPVAVNVDGIERLRRKWNWFGRTYYRLSERFSVWFANAIVTDARIMERYYRETYGAESVFIPYGAVTELPQEHTTLDSLGVSAGEYYLYVSRLEPENNAHLVVRAFEQVRTGKNLLVVGDAPYATAYIRQLKQTRDPRIRFTGAIYGDGYRQLLANAFCYIHATEVGGTHPALIEAMGMGNLIVANNTPENAEVLGETGVLYRKNDIADLTRCLQEAFDAPERFETFRLLARKRTQEHYTWETVVTQYEKLFATLIHD